MSGFDKIEFGSKKKVETMMDQKKRLQWKNIVW